MAIRRTTVSAVKAQCLAAGRKYGTARWEPAMRRAVELMGSQLGMTEWASKVFAERCIGAAHSVFWDAAWEIRTDLVAPLSLGLEQDRIPEPFKVSAERVFRLLAQVVQDKRLVGSGFSLKP